SPFTPWTPAWPMTSPRATLLGTNSVQRRCGDLASGCSSFMMAVPIISYRLSRLMLPMPAPVPLTALPPWERLGRGLCSSTNSRRAHSRTSSISCAHSDLNLVPRGGASNGPPHFCPDEKSAVEPLHATALPEI